MKRLALLLLGAAWQILPAHPQGLAIAPVMIDAPAGGGAASLVISSGLAGEITVQVGIFDWTQAGGKEQLTPARGLRFAPEIFTLSPGSSQVVRISVPDTGGEGAWRVIIDELPPPARPREAGAAHLSIRLRYVLAMFAGKPAPPEMLEARLEADELTLRNPGPGWLKLHNLSLKSEEEVVPAGPGIVYLLPQSEMRFPAPEAAAFSALNYSVNGEPFSASLQPVR